jgi:hypothetical protein
MHPSGCRAFLALGAIAKIVDDALSLTDRIEVVLSLGGFGMTMDLPLVADQHSPLVADPSRQQAVLPVFKGWDRHIAPPQTTPWLISTKGSRSRLQLHCVAPKQTTNATPAKTLGDTLRRLSFVSASWAIEADQLTDKETLHAG